VPDDNDERAPAVAKALDATRHELATNPLSLVRRAHRHRPERRAHDRADGERAEHDVAHDRTISSRDKGEEDAPSFAKGIDDSAFQLLIEGLSIDFPNSIDIAGLLVAYINHAVLVGPVVPVVASFT
jgi:hypothetical protein